METKDLTDEQLRKLADMVLDKKRFAELLKEAIVKAGDKKKGFLLGIEKVQ